ncbi:NADH-ubiquinone oxidoreductase chain C [Minicystis rosea]|nr:NADH-ubiquinone oxidoreductase chain C [Minicystis rosea]
MTPEAIFQRLVDAFGAETVFDLHADPAKARDPWFQVAPAHIEQVCERLRDDPELHCETMECLTGVDYPSEQKIAVVYHLFSFTQKHRVVLKCFLDRAAPSIPTLVNVWSSANWQERECFDLLGVDFEGHPDLRRLLLPDDWEGHPLRKDYKEAESYHGIPTVRPNPVELLKLRIPGKNEEGTKA